MKTTWRDEFGEEFAVPQEVVEMVDDGRLTDESWHNDACPSFTARRADGKQVRLWVDHPDPQMREMGSEWPRFGLQVEDSYGENVESIWGSDDLQEVLSRLP